MAADVDDLAVLAAEARRRGVPLNAVLRDAVTREAQRLRDGARPPFGIVHGDSGATRAIAADEHAPARGRGRR